MKKSETSNHLLQEMFFDYRMDEFVLLIDNLSKLEGLLLQLRAAGIDIPDTMFVAKVMNSLPKSYRYLISAWDSLDESKKTKNALTARLLKEKTLNIKYDKEDDRDEVAFTAKGSRCHGVSGGSLRSQSSHSNAIKDSWKKKVKCYICEKIGHIAKECRSRSDGYSSSSTKNKSRDHRNNSASKQGGKFHRNGGALTALSSTALLVNVKEDWIVDCGATEYMTNQSDLIIDMQSISNYGVFLLDSET